MIDAPLSSRGERQRRRAQAYLDAGDLVAAEAAYRQVLDEAPRDVEALLAVARIALARDAWRDAQALVRRAAAVRPTPPAAVLDLCEALRAIVDLDLLADVTDAAMDGRATMPVGARRRVAVTLIAAGENARARAWLDDALADAPDDAACLANRGMVRIAAGDFAGASRDLRRALDGREVPLAHWQLAQLDDDGDREARIARLRAVLASPAASDDDRAYLGFALHAILDRAGRYDEAFAALDAACRAHRRALPFDEARDVALFDALARADFRPRAAVDARRVPAGPVPIFIVGMFRSGTTLLERLLGAHPAVADLGESQRLAAALGTAADHRVEGAMDATLVARADAIDDALAGEAFVAACRRRAGDATHATEKLPSNFLALGFIRRALPHARVLHLVRDPMAVCWSNLRERFMLGAPYSFDQGELARYFARYHRLMAHWHATLPGFVHDVRYEDLVADPERTMRGVLAHCGLAWHPACASTARDDGAVNTASAVQVRAPVHRRSVARWLPYAPHLAPLAAALRASGVTIEATTPVDVDGA